MLNLFPALLLAAALLPPQAAAPATQTIASPPGADILLWSHGVPPQGIDRKEDFGNHIYQISHREVSGAVEVHQTKVDVIVVQNGEANLTYGGEGLGMKVIGPNELLGTSIRGGKTIHVSAGDVIHIPAGVPHQFILEPGHQITSFIVKVVTGPAAK